MFRDNYLSIDWLNVQVSHFPNSRLQGFMQEFSHPVQRFCEHIAADKVYFIEFNFKNSANLAICNWVECGIFF